MSARRERPIPLMRTRSSKDVKGRSRSICPALSGPMWIILSSSTTVAEFTSTCPALQPCCCGGSGVAAGRGVAVGGGSWPPLPRLSGPSTVPESGCFSGPCRADATPFARPCPRTGFLRRLGLWNLNHRRRGCRGWDPAGGLCQAGESGSRRRGGAAWPATATIRAVHSPRIRVFLRPMPSRCCRSSYRQSWKAYLNLTQRFLGGKHAARNTTWGAKHGIQPTRPSSVTGGSFLKRTAICQSR